MDNFKYSIIIDWSDEDNKYIVTLPDFKNSHTHGATYEEAVKNAQEALELLVESFEELGLALPQPHAYAA